MKVTYVSYKSRIFLSFYFRVKAKPKFDQTAYLANMKKGHCSFDFHNPPVNLSPEVYAQPNAAN